MIFMALRSLNPPPGAQSLCDAESFAEPLMGKAVDPARPAPAVNARPGQPPSGYAANHASVSSALIDPELAGPESDDHQPAVHEQSGTPRHLAIIMDGNGRWAERRGLERAAGHRAGAAAVRRVVEAAARAGIGWLTLYAFSTENWRRPPAEIQSLWELLRQFLLAEEANLRRQHIRLTAIGRRDRLPRAARIVLEWVERRTAAADGLHLRLALDYGAQWAIAEAARRAAQAVLDGNLRPEAITPESFAQLLASACGAPDAGVPAPPPDLLIRTGGEQRLSNFLLWECAYAELWFTPVLWPDFDAATLDQALCDFHQRQRNFGGRPAHASASF